MKDNILQKYIEGNATQQEKENVAQWLDASPDNMRKFLALRKIYDISTWQYKDLSKITEKTRINKNTPNTHTKKSTKLIRELAKVAAIFLVALGGYQLLLAPDSPTNIALQSIYSPEGQRTELVLSDGTKVWLNAKSSLTFPDRFALESRTVELDGEAYFDVQHDSEKKFVVKTKLYDIIVHGTEFNVTAYDNEHFETALIKGSVELLSNLTDEKMMLTPNTKAYIEDRKLTIAEVGSMDQFLWKKGILYFENLTVQSLFDKLEMYYDVKVVVQNKEILQHQYTGKFWAKDGIDHLLKVLQLHHNFKYRKDNNYSGETKNTIIIY